MKLIVLSPEKTLLNEEVNAVELPGAKGRFMVLKDHAPVLTPLVAGVVRYDVVGTENRQEMEIGGGFAEISNDEICVCVG